MTGYGYLALLPHICWTHRRRGACFRSLLHALHKDEEALHTELLIIGEGLLEKLDVVQQFR